MNAATTTATETRQTGEVRTERPAARPTVPAIVAASRQRSTERIDSAAPERSKADWPRQESQSRAGELPEIDTLHEQYGDTVVKAVSMQLGSYRDEMMAETQHLIERSIAEVQLRME